VAGDEVSKIGGDRGKSEHARAALFGGLTGQVVQ
jgi:hypothetical protein